MTAVIKMENVSKSFQKNIVLDNLNLEVEQGELVAIIGKSGCGKSTLLNILGLLDKASKGKVEIFDPPRDLLDYNITLAPQSFSYVDIE